MLDHFFGQVPLLALLPVILSSRVGYAVIGPPLPVLRVLGEGPDVAVLLHSRKRGVQRRLLDDIFAVGERTDHSRDLITVGRPVQKKIKNDRVVIPADHVTADRNQLSSLLSSASVVALPVVVLLVVATSVVLRLT